MDISEGGLKIRTGSNSNETQLTPFHSIAVWSAVKFVLSHSEGAAAFLPLITDPENLDKKTLFKPLRLVATTTLSIAFIECNFKIFILFEICSASERRRLSSGSHAPIFTVVMRSKQPNQQSKQLECHA